MKLQGVIILRITDFQRFFDLDEFLVKKDEFCELMKRYGSRPFCNTKQERDLCGVVRNWINGGVITAEIRNDHFIINGANGRFLFPLGVLKEQIDKYYEKLGFNDIYGLTALYLLAGVNNKDCSFIPDYGIFFNDKKGICTENSFISLHKDIVLPKAESKSKDVFRLCVLANINAGSPIRISIDNDEVVLKEGQCIAGVFSESGCVTLLNREASVPPSVYAVLIPNMTHKCADLQLSTDGKTRSIAGVSTVWVEPGAGVAYVTAAGDVVYDKNLCYKLNSRVSIFKKNVKERKLLAIKKTDAGNYVLYTNSQIDH